MTAQSRHLFIGGPGRSGTSFLVRYLTGCGLDTRLSRSGAAAFWNEDAHAGLEDDPLTSVDLPYVLKSPWLYEYVDELLAHPSIRLDVVLLPLRDLSEAATSRAILERRAMHAMVPSISERHRSSETWGATSGGLVYSLHPLDQARLLALGFWKVVFALSQAQVPLVFLHFPRLATDPDYLYDAVKPWLPPTLDRVAANAVHHQLADPGKIRVRREMAEHSPAPTTPARVSAPGFAYPEPDEVDRIALGRELARLRTLLFAEQARSRELDSLLLAARSAAELAGERATSPAAPGPDPKP